MIECTAADAVPAADVSWLLPEGVSVEYRFNATSQNRSHSVRGLVLLPTCTPRELTVQCMINHPALQKPQNTSVKLPLCGTFNESRDGLVFFLCSIDLILSFSFLSQLHPHSSYSLEMEIQYL